MIPKKTFIDIINSDCSYYQKDNRKKHVCINCAQCEVQTGKDVQIIYCHKCADILHVLRNKNKEEIKLHETILRGQSLPMACFQKIKGGGNK